LFNILTHLAHHSYVFTTCINYIIFFSHNYFVDTRIQVRHLQDIYYAFLFSLFMCPKHATLSLKTCYVNSSQSITSGTLQIRSTEVQSDLSFAQLYNSFSYRCNSIPTNRPEIFLM